MTTNKTIALRRRILKPYFTPVGEVGHFYKSHTLTHGFRRVALRYNKDVTKDYPIEVVRFMVNPQDPGCVHIHYLTNSYETAQRLSMMIPKDRRPWLNDQRSTWSYGLAETWHSEPAFSTSYRTRFNEWSGKPSPRQVGPFWLRNKKPKKSTTAIWLQGRKVEPGDVSDLQVDTTLNENELSYVEKVAMLADKKAWADAIRAGELPSFTE